MLSVVSFEEARMTLLRYLRANGKPDAQIIEIEEVRPPRLQGTLVKVPRTTAYFSVRTTVGFYSVVALLIRVDHSASHPKGKLSLFGYKASDSKDSEEKHCDT
jgi:hypothetical protein